MPGVFPLFNPSSLKWSALSASQDEENNPTKD
jgi:hypothetical protein